MRLIVRCDFSIIEEIINVNAHFIKYLFITLLNIYFDILILKRTRGRTKRADFFFKK